MKKSIPQYIVDAFAERTFEGNPAAVCVLEEWLPEELLLDIARENNLSETAFLVREGEGWRLRWMTPGGEIDLCGHATLAAAFVLMSFEAPGREAVAFQTLSGPLTVCRRGDRYEMDFPAYALRQVPVTEEMAQAIGIQPLEAWMGRDLVCVLGEEAQVRQARPDLERVEALEGLLLHLTAPGRDYACVSRSFAPKLHVPEDLVCGSGHCHIAPLWAKKLGRRELTARQASRRGGTLYCRVEDDRVCLAGKAALFSRGEIFLPVDKGQE